MAVGTSRQETTVMLIRQVFLLLSVFLMLFVPARAHASDCVAHYPAPETTARMFDAAQELRRSLNALSPQTDVVLLARGGQDLSRFGLVYSHLAFALRDEHGQWRAVHLLNHCKTGHSDLYREGLVNFIGESVLRADILVLVPQADVQEQLKGLLIGSQEALRSLHQPRYNLAAYPFSTQYQNSNQWVLEVLVAAVTAGSPSSRDRKQIQTWLRNKGYRPGILHIKLHERLAARFGIDNATTVDHPVGERLSGDYSVVTVDSVIDFMKAQHWLGQEFPVRRTTGTRSPPGD